MFKMEKVVILFIGIAVTVDLLLLSFFFFFFWYVIVCILLLS